MALGAILVVPVGVAVSSSGLALHRPGKNWRAAQGCGQR
jgi:hypothetical protein